MNPFSLFLPVAPKPDLDPHLKTSLGPLDLINPFLPAYGPPTAPGDQIRRAFRSGWAGAVTKTMVPDTMEIADFSPRFAAWNDTGSGLLGFENIELFSKNNVAYRTREIAAICSEYPDQVLVASIMASPDLHEWQDLAFIVKDAGADAVEPRRLLPARNAGAGA